MAAPLVDRCVVISLARRPDRLAEFQQSFSASGWEGVLGQALVFEAVDGMQAPVPSHLSDQPGVYGCWASHVAVLQRALDDDVQTIAVFEDDALLPADSADWLEAVLRQLPESAVALWLDATLLGEGNRLLKGTFGSARLVRPPLRTHAYILGRPAIEQLLVAAQQFASHIDRIYASAPLRGAVYAAVPSLAIQSTSASDVRSGWQQLVAAELQRSNPSRWLRRLSSSV